MSVNNPIGLSINLPPALLDVGEQFHSLGPSICLCFIWMLQNIFDLVEHQLPPAIWNVGEQFHRLDHQLPPALAGGSQRTKSQWALALNRHGETK
jgi:hypothetical protein